MGHPVQQGTGKEEEEVRLLERFRRNQHGLVWQWVASFFAIILFGIMTFVLNFPMGIVFSAVTDFGWPAPMRNALTLWGQVLSFLGVLFLFSLLIWNITQAQKDKAMGL